MIRDISVNIKCEFKGIRDISVCMKDERYQCMYKGIRDISVNINYEKYQCMYKG